MAVLEIEGLGQVEVDDAFTDFSPAEQQDFVDQLTQSVEGGVTSGSISLGLPEIDTPPTADEAGTGFFERAEQVIEAGGREFAGSSAEGLSAFLTRFGLAPETSMDLQKYADRQDVKVSEIPGIKPIQDADDAGDVISSILEYTGMSLPALGASVATGAVTGAAAGSVFPGIGNLLGAIGGGAGALYLSFVGNNVEETKRQTGRDHVTQAEFEAAATTAIGQSLADSLINRLLPLRFNKGAITNVLGKTVAGAGVEGSTEIAQEALTILQANDFNLESLRSPEAQRRLTESALAGTGAGGLVTGASALVTPMDVTTKEGEEAVKAAEPLEEAQVLSQQEIILNEITRSTDPESDVFKQLSESVQGLNENTTEINYNDVVADIDTRLAAVQEEIKNTKGKARQTERYAALKGQRDILKSSRDKLKEIEDTVSFVGAQTGLNEGQVRVASGTARKAAQQTPLGTLVRAGTQAVTPMLAGAQKSPIVREMVARFNNFDPQRKVLQAAIIKPIYDTQQKAAKAFKVPFTSAVSRRRRAAISEILDANRSNLDENIIVNEDVQKILNQFDKTEQDILLEVSNDLKRNNDGIFKQLRDEGIFTDEDYLSGYMSANHKWIRRGEKGIRQFVDSAIKTGITRKQAEDIARSIQQDFESQYSGPEFSARDMALRGSIAKAVRKQAGFEKERKLPRDITTQLLKDGLIDNDVFNVNTRYAQQAAHVLLMKQMFGDNFGNIISREKSLATDPEVQTALARADDVYSALQGRYNPFRVMPGWRGAISKLIQFEYILTLSTAGITALSEPIILLSRARPGDAFYGIKQALKIAYRKSIREIFPRLSKSEVENEFELMLYGIDSVLSERLISSSAVDVSTIATEKYFKLNFLAQVTQFSRAIAFYAGKRAIDRDLAIAKSIPNTARGRRDKANSIRRLSELGLKDLENINEEALKVAQMRLVDDIIMTPNIVNRPLWMANPALAPVAQLKSFMFVFGNVVGSRIWNEAAFGRTLEGAPLDVQERAKRMFQFGVAFTLLTGAAGFLMMFKDALRNWDEEDSDFDPSGAEFWTEAFIGSNLFGPYTIGFQAIQAPKYGISPVVSILGPAAGQSERILKAVGTFVDKGDAKPLARELVRVIPFIGANPSARNRLVDEIEEGILDGSIDISQFTDI